MNFTLTRKFLQSLPIGLTILLAVCSLQTMAQADNCAGATAATVNNAACTVTSVGTTVGATNSGIATTCGTGTPDDDVWYSFVARGGTLTATVTAGTMTNPAYEIFSGTCGALTSIYCRNASGGGNETGTVSNLINGNTYYIRVFSSGNGTGQGTFTLCLTVPNPPANDNCLSATVLTPAATCVNGTSQTTGTLVNAQNSGIATTCGGFADDDVWYSFVAQYPSQTVTLSGIGSAIAVNGSGLGGSAQLEVFSGTCAGLTSIACGAMPLPTSTTLIAYANNLIVGNTYYVRVYSTNSVSLNANAGFTICITNPPTAAPTLFFGKSFINITKGNNGGTVEPGDVLEIRAAVVVRATSALDSCAFFDNVPAGTSFVPGSLAILTNEGKIYKSFTDAAGDDAGWITGSAIQINMGYNSGDNPATATRKGHIRNTHVPVVSGTCVMLASYRVVVTASLNSVISLGGGTFTYSNIATPTTVNTYTFNQNNVIVYTNNGLCSNASGVNVLDNGINGDYTGTFGNGNTINRSASPNMPVGYTYVTQVGGKPGDFEYTITNNMSNNAAGYSTSNAWPKPESPGTHRIFGVWDVVGDHTGASDPLAGNPAADTTGGNTGGYMLLVNSAYNLDTVFKYPISGLCPNTYYELSFWVRNVCSRCGIDSVGRGASGVSVPAGYIPTAPGDSSGVYPNLSMSIDNINHYTTGNILYTGQWVKKGFVFRTGASQTNIEFAITNNAPGGGGNDWALDDISLATCTPNLNLVPSGNSQVCYGQQVDLNCNVISYFNNYVYYQWQVSHDNGTTWADTLSMGTGTPTLSGGNYVYNAVFPSFLADSSQHMVQYRIRVATTPANLYGGCSFYNSANIIVMVNNCQWVLKTNLVSFDAAVQNRHAVLNWRATNETDQTTYELQKSSNGIDFTKIALIKANNTNGIYQFTDPEELNPLAYYRVVVKEPGGFKNSRIRLVSVSTIPFDLLSIVNPFNDRLKFEVSASQNSVATIVISDQHGKAVRTVRQNVTRGMNNIEITNLSGLATGTYILQVSTADGTKSKKIVKTNQ